MPHVALYCRVSTDEQAERGFSIDNQKQRLVAFCQSQGWNEYMLYVDDGFSGTNLHRPALRYLLENVHAGTVDRVIVYKLDRLSRRQRDVLHLLEDEFEHHHVAFRSATEPFDTATPLGKAMLGILAVFSQLERDTIVDRLSTGLRQRVLSGKWPGGRVPFGYRYDFESGKLRINPQQADLVRQLFHRFLQGMSLTDLALWLTAQSDDRKFSHSVVRQMLQRSVYMGESTFGEAVSASVVERAIVDEDTFCRVQKEMEQRHGNRSSGKYLLSGLLRCKLCEAPLIHVLRRSRSAKGGSYSFYACRNQHRRAGSGQPACKVGYRRQADLESFVMEQLFDTPLQPSVVEQCQVRFGLYPVPTRTGVAGPVEVQSAAPQPWDGSALERSLESELKRVAHQLDRWYTAFEDDLLTTEDLKTRVTQLQQRQAKLQQRLNELKRETKAEAPWDSTGLETHASVAEHRFPLRQIWPQLTFSERRTVLHAAISVVIVGPRPETPEIVWN